MRFHDFSLLGYQVIDGGETIIFDLLYEYPNEKSKASCIRFTGVAIYNFAHTAKAIITDIYETPVSEMLTNYRSDIEKWARLYSLKFWQDDGLVGYIKRLEADGYKAWKIESAIGFQGFIVARKVSNA